MVAGLASEGSYNTPHPDLSTHNNSAMSTGSTGGTATATSGGTATNTNNEDSSSHTINSNNTDSGTILGVLKNSVVGSGSLSQTTSLHRDQHDHGRGRFGGDQCGAGRKQH